MDPREKLKHEVERQSARRRKADAERPTLIGQTVYLGTLGLVFVLPVVAGAYLGLWLDGFAEDYSSRWTISLILVGVFVGAVNVYLFLRE